MKELEDKIRLEGKVLAGNIVKVSGFLNHRLDVSFIMKMGEEIARLYKDEKVDKILTIESSGIAIAFAAATYLKVPVVFAKKNNTSNLSADLYTAQIHSFTHGREYQVVVSKEYIGPGERALVVDDFLANGNALRGLYQILGQAQAKVVGTAIAIEKGFQGGGDELRKEGYRIDSLAIIESMDEQGIVFRG